MLENILSRVDKVGEGKRIRYILTEAHIVALMFFSRNIIQSDAKGANFRVSLSPSICLLLNLYYSAIVC